MPKYLNRYAYARRVRLLNAASVDFKFLEQESLFSDVGNAEVTISRNTTATYFNRSGILVTAAVDEPRFEWDPTTNKPKGFLIEESRTNFFLNSDTPETHSSPSLNTGDYCLWMVGTGSIAVTAVTATITGAGTATDGSPVVFEVTAAGTVLFTVSGDVTRAQCENDVNPSSYIPTQASSVTRGSDVVNISGVSDFYNPSEGTVIFEGLSPPIHGQFNQVFYTFSNGTASETLAARRLGNLSTHAFYERGNVTQLSLVLGTTPVGENFKTALAYKLNDGAATTNGETPDTDTQCTLPIGTNTCWLGRAINQSEYFFGHVHRFRYFPRRLANDVIVDLTKK